jgi:hypothetical protein
MDAKYSWVRKEAFLGDLQRFKCIHPSLYDNECMILAFETGKIEIVKYLETFNFKIPRSSIYMVIYNGHLQMLQYAAEKKIYIIRI